ncbi:Phosphodiest-domain-containing protein [Anaeromyces robustus]|uniref:Phosphodiest-domain-containing protein n=1 Tax=Anaeromyces robustus TaxID=1754192 RepID=A0A1Y1X8Q0_9FUNG|nr:Phosphodiest-domain-containing protein [Anaeromyces robustus]|eukprot:ORX81796.1 Phosphodiest-domain-containing protein [Anaeromyces robustus]
MICKFSNPIQIRRSKHKHLNDNDDNDNTVIIVSIDGFRNDYMDRIKFTKTLNKLSKKGNKAEFMKPSFPTSTFPNHYTLATGLYPESHGIVANTFYDKHLNLTFNIRDNDLIKMPEWWGGSPIWVEAEKNNIKSAVCMWVGCNVVINGYSPSYVVEFNPKTSLDEKLSMVNNWLKLPKEEKPKLILVYLPEVDKAAHSYGVNSDEVNVSLLYVDKFIRKLYKKINKRKFRDNTNLIILSDHGMADYVPYGRIYIDDAFDEEDGLDIISYIPHLTIKNQDNLEHLYERMLAESTDNGHWIAMKREEIFEKYHYSHNDRISPIFGLAENGYTFAYRSLGNSTIPRAMHGYDNDDVNMRSLFLGVGPVFSKYPGQTLPSFNNVEVYNLVAKILNITDTLPPNNGTAEAMDMFKYYLNL